MRALAFTFLFFATLLPGLRAQSVENRSPLTIEQIMQGEKFVGFLPEDIRWSEDSRVIYFSWNPEQDTLRSLYKVVLGASQAPQRVSLEEEKQLPEAGAYNHNRSLMVYEQAGDLFLLEASTGKQRQITNTVGGEGNPSFSGDGQQVVYTYENNLFAWNIQSGATQQLTDFRKGNERKSSRQSQQAEWLSDSQEELFGVLREREAERNARKARRDALKPARPTAFYYGEKRLFNLRISPNLRFVTFSLSKEADDKATQVPDYVTASGYVEDMRGRPKVGGPQDSYEMGIYDRQRDTVYFTSAAELEGIRAKPAFLLEYHRDTTPFNPLYEKPKPVIFLGPVFSEGGRAAIVVRSQDNKDRWIATLNLEQGTLNQLDWQHDEAWIGGPGIVNWDFSTGTLGWLDEERLFFQSEATGFSHLYTLNTATGEKRALTNGPFEILDVQLSHDKRWFYLNASAEGPYEHHFYRLPTSGGTGKLERITSLPGNNEVVLSPDEKYLAIRYSASNLPWELYLMENKPGTRAQRLTSSTTPAFNAYAWREPAIIRFKARDGALVPARLYRPEGQQSGGPAVIFVHGAGYLQNVHKWWSSYYREYMFHNLLADNGYTVLDIDYRGSAGYGRDWRTAIYRHMGGKDLDDQVDGARYMAEAYGIGSGQIGIYGGSYGGFITLMAMFTAPGTFSSGAALRSVTDWAHYNHGYTSDILNTPVEDSIAYRRSSPIYFANGLQGRLLMLHGVVDSNVQFQDIVRLSQRLIELGKDNWELALFPVEGHGFAEPSSWADEYKRIYKLFQQTLKE